MTKMNLKEVEKVAKMYNNDLSLIEKNLKRVASQKSRFKNQIGHPNYDEKMTEILKEYQLLKDAKSLLEPKKKFAIDLTKEDIDIMTYDEVLKSRNSIASKMTHTRYNSTIPEDNDEFRKAKRIDEMLKERLKVVKPIDEEVVVRKSDIKLIIDTIKTSGNLSQERIIELLERLI